MKSSILSVATIALTLVGVEAQRTIRLPPIPPILPRPSQLAIRVEDIVQGLSQLTNLTQETNEIFAEILDELEGVDVEVLNRDIPELIRNLGSLPAILERDILVLTAVQLPDGIRQGNATAICEEFTEFTIAQRELVRNIASGAEFLSNTPQGADVIAPISNILALVRRLADDIYNIIPSCADDVEDAIEDLQSTFRNVSSALTRTVTATATSTTARPSPTAS